MISSLLLRGEREERYEGFAFGRSATVFLDENCLLISRESALQYVDKLKAEQSPKSADAVPVSDNGSSADTGSVIDTSSTVICRFMEVVLANPSNNNFMVLFD